MATTTTKKTTTKKMKAREAPPASRDVPRGERPGDGAGRIENPGAQGADVRSRGFGDAGSNAGEVDPGIGGGGDTVGEVPAGAGGGAGFGNAIGGGDDGDVPESASEPAR